MSDVICALQLLKDFGQFKKEQQKKFHEAHCELQSKPPPCKLKFVLPVYSPKIELGQNREEAGRHLADIDKKATNCKLVQ